MKYSGLDEEELEYRVGKTAFTAITDSIVDTQSAIKVLAVTVTAELGAFAMLYVSKDKVLDFLQSGDDVWIYAAIAVFLVGFLTAFAALCLGPSRFRRQVLSYTILPLSIAAGLANIALFFVLVTFRRR